MSNSPFFSIIIPTLNEEQRLPKLLSTLTRQTNQSFEVIVVDGGSTDTTVDKIKTFKKYFSIITLLSNKKNKPHQLNMGAKLASGNYLMFIDADVDFAADFLGELEKQLQKNAIDFATTRGIPDSQNIIDQSVTTLTYASMIPWAYLQKPFMSGENIIIKRETFNKTQGFDPSVVFAEDHEFVQRVARQGFIGRVFWKPAHIFSFRRFIREGRLTVVKKYVVSLLYLLFKGPVRKHLFEYQMGGGFDN